MKKVLCYLCVVIFISGVFLELKTESVQKTVSRNYTAENGLVRNYGRSQDISILSESTGQYMEYLLLMKDDKNFYKQTELLQDDFLVRKNDALFIKWQLGDHISTNAAIDDLRIIKNLKEAGQVFQRSEYNVLAKKLEETLLTYQLEDGILTDFYDWKSHQKSPLVHLSYIDFDAFKNMIGIDQTAYRGILEQASLKGHPFFQEIWNTEKKKYEQANEKEVDLIDQLLIAIQYVKGVDDIPVPFDEWLKKEWQTKEKLYGRYQKKGEAPSVSYESSAVYALTVQYFSLTGQDELADDLNQKVLKQLPFTVKESFSSIHFFDYMLAQIAVERFEQEQSENK
ncbi:hypothetical protein JTF06_00150 [Desemzia sp. RIT804]|uniref:hypothetical protein n=1 Tax=Desemzia sp. RIT 804 TaxID=2810209 RepID=UPI00194EAA09|nr:hypothetical protein [Desemzia sp. RIT 804]MBM6613297.1 hypothetical protein [Desemzia sp. RIT 804]